jgi:hypothetical protein
VSLERGAESREKESGEQGKRERGAGKKRAGSEEKESGEWGKRAGSRDCRKKSKTIEISPKIEVFSDDN